MNYFKYHDLQTIPSRIFLKTILCWILVLLIASCNTGQTNSSKIEGENSYRWDFSSKKKFIYSYSQTSKSEHSFEENEPARKNVMSGDGKLSIRVTENNTAVLSLTNLQMQVVGINEDGTPSDTMTQMAQPLISQEMNSDGSFSDSYSQDQFDIFFPLPKNSLKEGDSEDIPTQTPFNANGSMLFSKGNITITHEGYQDFDGRKCTVFKGVIDISELDMPEEIKGEYECTTTGQSTYYFDVEEGCFTAADIKVSTYIYMNADSENEDDFGVYAKMKSESSYRIRLESIEELN